MVLALVVVLLAVAWRVTPLARLADPHALAVYEQSVRDWPLAPLVAIAAFVVGGLIAAPATLMIGATTLLFGAWPGSAYAFGGMLVNGLVVYAIGRSTARGLVDDWLAKRAGSKLDSFNRRLGQRGFVAVALIRLTPIPYTVQNLMAGASRIGLGDFVVGTALGIVPVIALMAGVAAEFDAWLMHPDRNRLLMLVGAAVAMLLIGWALRRWAVRRRTDR